MTQQAEKMITPGAMSGHARTTGRTARERLGATAYHGAVGLLALALGVGALTAGARGTSGAAAMDETTVSPAAVGLRVDLAVAPATPKPGLPATFSYRLVDTRSGRPLTALPLEHERPMHLTAVSRDLQWFQHIHPQIGPNGRWSVSTTLGPAGTYILYVEFAHGGRTVLGRRAVTVGMPSAVPALIADLTPRTVDGVTVTLAAPRTIAAGSAASFVYHLTRGGRPVTDLEPYLGAAAHVAIVSADTRTFTHTHGEAGGGGTTGMGDTAMGGMVLPSHFGPDVTFSHTFARPGLYKIWAQFGERGRILTAAFVVPVH